MRGSSSDVLGSAPIDTFADLYKGRNRSTSRLWVTQEANAGTDFGIAQKPLGQPKDVSFGASLRV